MKKATSLILCVIIVMITALLPTSAENNGISPLFNNVALTSTQLLIDSNGLACVSVEIVGYPNLTTGGTITIKLQKKTLGLFWWDVDNGQADNTWTINFTGDIHTDECYLQLTSTGTYRAVVEFTVYGSGGDTDVIEQTSEYKYS